MEEFLPIVKRFQENLLEIYKKRHAISGMTLMLFMEMFSHFLLGHADFLLQFPGGHAKHAAAKGG